MDTLKNTVNLLDLTDEEVAVDWKLGYKRALARLSIMDNDKEILKKFDNSRYFYVNRTSSNHIRSIIDLGNGNYDFKPKPDCVITSVTEIREESSLHYHGYGVDDKSTDVEFLAAKVSCACGRIKNKMLQISFSRGSIAELMLDH